MPPCRRATGHNRYTSKRRPNLLKLTRPPLKKQKRSDRPRPQQGAAAAAAAAAAATQDGTLGAAAACPQPPTNRAMRRRPARLLAAAVRSTAPCLQLPASLPSSAVGAEALCEMQQRAAAGSQQQQQQQQLRLLETHAWHARRMRMAERGLWGHGLALQAAGRGRGSRSFLHQLRWGGGSGHKRAVERCSLLCCGRLQQLRSRTKQKVHFT